MQPPRGPPNLAASSLGHVLRWCGKNSITVGLVVSPDRQKLDYHSGNSEEQLLENHPGTLIDLRGRTNLIQLAGACRIAQAVVSVDAGPMHVAAGVGTPTLAVVGNDAEAAGQSNQALVHVVTA